MSGDGSYVDIEVMELEKCGEDNRWDGGKINKKKSPGPWRTTAAYCRLNIIVILVLQQCRSSQIRD